MCDPDRVRQDGAPEPLPPEPNSALRALGYPILPGPAQVVHRLHLDLPEAASRGTAATVGCGSSAAHIVRVHDVVQGRVARMTDAIYRRRYDARYLGLGNRGDRAATLRARPEARGPSCGACRPSTTEPWGLTEQPRFGTPPAPWDDLAPAAFAALKGIERPRPRRPSATARARRPGHPPLRRPHH